MVTFNALEHGVGDQLTNEAHQHAFFLVGKERLFGVHMTQFHCELHKYQVIFQLWLPNEVYQQYIELRAANPKDSFLLCNAKDTKNSLNTDVRSFSIPDLVSGNLKAPSLESGKTNKFSANIFQGIRPLSEAEIAADSHFFPWAKKYVKPAIGEFEVTVKRIVCFRPFDHLATLPLYARYLIWGDAKSGETHMTNLQNASMVSNVFEPQVFGPDYDHVMSLAARPDWLEQDDSILEAGIVVSTPIVQLLDADSGEPTIPDKQPFPEGSEIEVLYRGIGPTRKVTAGPSVLFATAVCNSPRFFFERPTYNNYLDHLPPVPEVLDISIMPKRYWAFAPDREETE